MDILDPLVFPTIVIDEGEDMPDEFKVNIPSYTEEVK